MEWIFEIVDGYDYKCLLRQLMLIEFHSDIWLDNNLMKAVYEFRSRMGSDYDGPDSSPSVLEIFVVLAVHCEDKIMHDDDRGNRTSDWFWVILENLGLDDYNDNRYASRIAERVEDIIDIFLSRDYEYDGSGGSAFPLREPLSDMRDVDLWQQLNWWLVENKYEEEFR